MQLQQDINCRRQSCRRTLSSEAFGLAVNLLQQAQGVDGMYHADHGSHGLHLVLLQMTDEMPFHIVGHGRGFLTQLLGTAFTEYALPRSIGFLKFLYGMELRYGYKANSLRKHAMQFFYPLLYLSHSIL